MRFVNWLALAPLAISLNVSSLEAEAKTGTTSHHHHTKVCCAGTPCTSHKSGKDIVQTAAADSSLSTLVANLKAAKLMCTLKGKGPFTVFAPDNAAFTKFSKNNPLTSDQAWLARVLKYHVINKKLMASDLTKLRSQPTLEGESVMLNNKDGKEIVDGALVTKADIVCNNGVIHIIDTVLVPERGK